MKLIEIQRHYFSLSDMPGNIYYCTSADTDISLNVKKLRYVPCTANMELVPGAEEETLYNKDLNKVRPLENTLGMAYTPASKIHSMHLNTPDSMGYDIHEALKKLKKAVGDITDFVCERLQWSRDEISERLFAEQVDAVALAIYNFEARNQSMIIGDQTGIGKGRVAASIIRYAYVKNLIPIYVTEDASLFSDTVYRDLCDIGSGDMKPFILNSDTKAQIKVLQPDDTYKVIYQPITDLEYKKQLLESCIDPITEEGDIPEGYDYILMTYSQLKQTWDKNGHSSSDHSKFVYLKSIAAKSMFVFDESHNLSGSKAVKEEWWKPDSEVVISGSTTFRAFSALAKLSGKVLFLSATFAKRPENMVIYAENTCVNESGLTSTELIGAISKGGEALQEVISSSIVHEGQMIRRESGMDGIEPPNYIELSKKGQKEYPNLEVQDYEAEHRSKCDEITEIIRDINEFEQNFIMSHVDTLNNTTMDDVVKRDNMQGVNHAPIFSKLFQTTSELLYCIKAEATAEHALMRLRQGKKVVIALSNTMQSFLDPKLNPGLTLNTPGTKLDFTNVLERSLRLTLRIMKKDAETGQIIKGTNEDIKLSDLCPEAQAKYHDIEQEIAEASIDVTISPIDLIEKRLQDEGWKVAEVTGRQYCAIFDDDDCLSGKIVHRGTKKKGDNSEMVLKEKKNEAFSKFQNNKVDVLIINKSGSTGASAHATTKNTNLRPDQVKQRCMIIAQAELDINSEVQKRGRINRTGQIKELPPIYDYLISAIPAERRLMMILQKKLRSLDANTTAKQKQSTGIIDVPDFFNKYGNEICIQYLTEHPEINAAMNNPLKVKENEKKTSTEETESTNGELSKGPDFLKKVTGYVPLLKCSEQDDFYNTISEQYEAKINDLKARGEYDLEVEAMDLDAAQDGDLELIESEGTGKSNFADALWKGNFDCKNLRKPFSEQEVKSRLKAILKGKDGKDLAKEQITKLREYYRVANQLELKKIENTCKNKLSELRTKIENAEKEGKPMPEDEQDDRKNKIMESMRNNLAKAKGKQERFMQRFVFVEFFWAGRACVNGDDVKMICLGCNLSEESQNKYTPSSIRISFALANTEKFMELNLADAGAKTLQEIMDITNSLNLTPEELRDIYINDWHTYIKEYTASRINREILVGNILKGCSQDIKGKQLISFTTKTGDIMKGILLPIKSEGELKTVRFSKIPISKFENIFLKNIVSGDYVHWNLSNGFELDFNFQGFDIRLVVPKNSDFKNFNKQWNSEFEKLEVRGRTFQDDKNISGKKVASCCVSKNNLLPLLEILSDIHLSVELAPSDIETYFPSKHLLKTGNWPELETDPTLIPPNTSLQEGEFMFLNVL